MNYTGIVLLFNVVTSQIAKYDMFTDINYVLDNYRCKNMGIFYASLIIMSVTMFFNMVILFTFLLKIFWKTLMLLCQPHWLHFFK